MNGQSPESGVRHVFVSVVVPVKDEEGNVVPLIEEICAAVVPMGKPYEIIFVDDGSSDRTLDRLLEARGRFPELRVIKFAANRGQTAGTDAGLRAARGEWVATLDGDRQNDPGAIPRMIEEAMKGYDMVAGWREKRNDTVVRRISSRIANATRDWMLHDGIKDTGCALKVMRRSCLERIKLYTGMHRFLPALFQIEGFRVAQMPVKHRPRTAGRTKYGILNRVFRALNDLMAVRWMQKRALRYKIEKEW